MKNVPLKNRVIVRINLFELILEITLFLSGSFLRESRNLYRRHGHGSITQTDLQTNGHTISPLERGFDFPPIGLFQLNHTARMPHSLLDGVVKRSMPSAPSPTRG